MFDPFPCILYLIVVLIFSCVFIFSSCSVVVTAKSVRDVPSTGTIELSGPNPSFQCVTFRGDGKQIAVGGTIHEAPERGNQRGVRIWLIDVATRQVNRTFDVEGSGIDDLCYSPDGRWLASDIVKHDLLLKGEKQGVLARIRLWDLSNDDSFKDVYTSSNNFHDSIRPRFGFSSDSRIFFWACGEHAEDRLTAVDLESNRTAESSVSRCDFPLAIKSGVNPTETTLLACGYGWSVLTTPVLSLSREESFGIREVHSDRDESIVLAPICAVLDPNHMTEYIGQDGIDRTGGEIFTREANIQVYDLEKHRRADNWKVGRFGQTLHWFNLAVSPDGSFLAGASDYGVYLFNVGRRNLVAVLLGSNARFFTLYDVAFSPDSTLVAAGVGGKVYFWNISSITNVPHRPMK